MGQEAKCRFGSIQLSRVILMTVYVALLRAVNVGGRGILPMDALRTLCAAIGLTNVRTYIQSGNIVFDSPLPEQTLRRALARAVTDKMGRPIDVLIRTPTELRAVLDANPFPDSDPSLVGVFFLPKPVPERVLVALALDGPEDVRLIGREVFVHYPNGIGRSKIKLPFTANGTSRNLTTAAALLAMATGHPADDVIPPTSKPKRR
jgi:uncharacterized protein (DUF1697 family)